MTNSTTSTLLPGRLTPFIGRQEDLRMMVDLCQDQAVRLVTILGMGGIGKTRFALEVVSQLEERFQQSAVYIPLAQLRSGEELLPALAVILGVHLPPGGSLREIVLDHLSGRQTILVFDNFEHLLVESVFIRDILAAGPQVKVLVTSREKLRLEAETLFYLHGMELPPMDSWQNAEEYDAVRLFLQKARQARPDFTLSTENIPAVVQICRLVNGNPLGILLAAAWVEHFSPAEIVDQISDSLDFLASDWQDAEPRHTSMRAVFESSFQRLGEHEKAVFRKLAIFRGDFDLAAAQTVAGADLRSLIALVEKSLLTRSTGSGRYEMHELLRQYASEVLVSSDEHEDVFMAHAQYYISFVQQREARLISQAQTAALEEIQADFDNIRQAFSFVVGNRDFASVRAVLPGLYAFCDMHSRFYEGETIFRQAVEGLAPQTGESPHPAWALALLSWYDLRVYSARVETGEEIASQAQRCLAYARSIHDSQGIAASLVLLGAIAEDRGDFETALQNYEEAMRSDPSLDDIYWVNMRTGLCRQAAHHYPEAIQSFRTSLRRGKETGERVKEGWSLLNIGDTLLLQRKASEAEAYLEQAGALFKEVGTHFGILWSNYSLGRAALELGNLQRAREHAELAAQIARQIRSISWITKTDDLLQRIDPGFSPHPSRAAKKEDQVILSEREIEVLHLLQSDLNGPEIARRLYVSINTVRYHTKNLYQKLGVNSRLEAIRRAQELGL